MLNDKIIEDCTGCSACYNICPKQCIEMRSNHEGFRYPKIDLSSCIDCNLCTKICPTINTVNIKPEEIDSFAAFNPNEIIRRKSSSGGIFSLLAEHTINQAGTVFGATFTKSWDVEHTSTSTVEGIKLFRGSKYVQSHISNTYSEIKELLINNKNVLFSGTPCQIAGLKSFLCKDYDKLLCIDFICHGVPSPKAWSLYKEEISNNLKDIRNINFRNKDKGWENFNLKIEKNSHCISEPFNENIFMKGFLADLFLRPTCYKCMFKAGKSGADITLADFWGIKHLKPEIDDDKGISLVITNSKKGADIMSSINIDKTKVDILEATKFNPSYSRSAILNKKRSLFFRLIDNGNSFSNSVIKCLKPTLKEIVKNKIRSFIRR